MRSAVLPSCGLLVLVLSACASAGSAAGSPATPATTDTANAETAAPPKAPSRGSINLISEAEIKAAPSDVVTAFDLVSRLRPTMMRNRSMPALGSGRTGAYASVVAYVDNVKLGPVEVLRSLRREEIKEIRYINAIDATNRWGEGHPAGVVQVITVRTPRE